MPRFRQTKGPDARVLEQRLDTAIHGADAWRVRSLELAGSIAQAHARAAERAMLWAAFKHGGEDDAVVRARAAAEASNATVEAVAAEVEVARVAKVDVGGEEVLFHGRVVDRRGRGVADVEVAVMVSERSLGRDATDERGYYRVAVPIPAAAPGGARGEVAVGAELGERMRRTVVGGKIELVARRGERVIARLREALDAEAGAAVYRELSIERPG